MMKFYQKIVSLVLLSSLILIGFTGCDSNENVEDICGIKVDDLEGVSMKIKEGTLTKTGATVIIIDTSARQNIYGVGYGIEKEENGTWVELKPRKDMFFTEEGYYVDENHTLEFSMNWESFYGKLTSGKYRVVKTTSEAMEGIHHCITAKFVIE